MLYLLKVDALVAAVVFSASGLILLALFAWQQAKAYAAVRYRIYARVSNLITQPQSFANPLAISRTTSRFDERTRHAAHRIQ